MPSDQDELRAGWQDVGAVQSMQWAQPADAADQASGEEDDQSLLEPVDTDDLVVPDTSSEDELLTWAKQPLVSKDTLTTFGRQFSPLLVPLPFALIVFILTSLAAGRGWFFLNPLISGVVLLVLAILQGALLYSAGSNDTLWMVYIALGYALFILGGVLAAFGVGASLLALLALVLFGLFLTRRGIHPTPEGNVDLVASMGGKYTHTLYPGLNLLLPWERILRRLNIQESVWTSPVQRIPTAREQDVQLTSTISYQLLSEDAHLAALMVQNWESALQRQFIGTVQSVINELTPDDFVAWTHSAYATSKNDASSFNPMAATRWDRISAALCRRMQDHVAAWGVQINWIHIQDLTIVPRVQSMGLLEEGSVSSGSALISPSVSPSPHGVESLQAVQPVVPEPVKPSPPPLPPPSVQEASGKSVAVDTLVDFYNAVRQNAITDPAMILDIAHRFDLLAGDPVQSKALSFDAERAAATLRVRAQKLQELAQNKSAASAGPQE